MKNAEGKGNNLLVQQHSQRLLTVITNAKVTFLKGIMSYYGIITNFFNKEGTYKQEKPNNLCWH